MRDLSREKALAARARAIHAEVTEAAPKIQAAVEKAAKALVRLGKIKDVSEFANLPDAHRHVALEWAGVDAATRQAFIKNLEEHEAIANDATVRAKNIIGTLEEQHGEALASIPRGEREQFLERAATAELTGEDVAVEMLAERTVGVAPLPTDLEDIGFQRKAERELKAKRENRIPPELRGKSNAEIEELFPNGTLRDLAEPKAGPGGSLLWVDPDALAEGLAKMQAENEAGPKAAPATTDGLVSTVPAGRGGANHIVIP